MSEIPSGPIEAGETKAVSLLSRVILPRPPGEPLDVRKLYIEESDTNARRRTRPPGPRWRSARNPRSRSPPTSTRSRPAIGAAGRRSSRWCCASRSPARPASTSTGPSPPEPESRWAAPRSAAPMRRRRPPRSSRSPRPVRRRRMDLVRHHHRQQDDCAQRSWYAPVPAPGRASVAVGIPTFNRPADCVNALAALTSDPLVDNVITAVIVTDQAPPRPKIIQVSRRRPNGSATGCPSITSRTSAAQAATAG